MTARPATTSTPIYYVNDVPHIGHMYTTLACDVIARFKRLDGYDVHFLTGTDEHGQKVQKAAAAAGLSPQEFTDRVSRNFRELAALMNFSNDDFIRTTETRHKRACTALWERLVERNQIYLETYAGWYAVRDEPSIRKASCRGTQAVTGLHLQARRWTGWKSQAIFSAYRRGRTACYGSMRSTRNSSCR